MSENVNVNGKGMVDLLEITPLECKRNKKDTGWVCSVLVKGEKTVGGQKIPVQDITYISSDIEVPANKSSLCEVSLYAIDGDLVRKIRSIRKSA